MALVSAGVAGVLVLAALTWIIAYDAPHRPWIFNSQYPLAGFDLLDRFVQVNSARTGENIYAAFGANGFTYPPGAIFLFLPITFVPFREAFAAWTGVSVGCLALTYLVLLRSTERDLGWKTS